MAFNDLRNHERVIADSTRAIELDSKRGATPAVRGARRMRASAYRIVGDLRGALADEEYLRSTCGVDTQDQELVGECISTADRYIAELKRKMDQQKVNK